MAIYVFKVVNKGSYNWCKIDANNQKNICIKKYQPKQPSAQYVINSIDEFKNMKNGDIVFISDHNYYPNGQTHEGELKKIDYVYEITNTNPAPSAGNNWIHDCNDITSRFSSSDLDEFKDVVNKIIRNYSSNEKKMKIKKIFDTDHLIHLNTNELQKLKQLNANEIEFILNNLNLNEIQQLLKLNIQEIQQLLNNKLDDIQKILLLDTKDIQNLLNKVQNFSSLNENTKKGLLYLLYKKQVIFKGPPGTGKTKLAQDIAKNFADHSEMVVFHPSYEYNDFIEGIAPQKNSNGLPQYQNKNKIFLQLVNIAQANPDKNILLIIDEINRANTAAVFGELLYSLEYRNHQVRLQSGNVVSIPDNLYIIGTMNTIDRSLGDLDEAFKRRFAFLFIPSDRNVLQAAHEQQLYDDVEKIIKKYLDPDYDKEDVMLGHSYFLGANKLRLESEIRNILFDYVKNGILQPSAKDEIEKLTI